MTHHSETNAEASSSPDNGAMEEVPSWFDNNLKAALVNKVCRKRTVLSYFDSIILSWIEKFRGDAKWRFQKPYRWKEIEDYIESDCLDIKASGFVPDMIIGIKNGGAFIANYVAKCLEVERVEYIEVMLYRPILGSTAVAFAWRYFSSAQLGGDFSIDLTGKRVLLVDDQTYTGRTFLTATKRLKDFGVKEIRTYCMLTQRFQTDFGNRAGIMQQAPWGDDP